MPAPAALRVVVQQHAAPPTHLVGATKVAHASKRAARLDHAVPLADRRVRQQDAPLAAAADAVLVRRRAPNQVGAGEEWEALLLLLLLLVLLLRRRGCGRRRCGRRRWRAVKCAPAAEHEPASLLACRQHEGGGGHEVSISVAMCVGVEHACYADQRRSEATCCAAAAPVFRRHRPRGAQPLNILFPPASAPDYHRAPPHTRPRSGRAPGWPSSLPARLLA